MPFYRKKVTYDEMAPYIKKFKEWLRLNASFVGMQEDLGHEEVFLVDRTKPSPNKAYDNYWSNLLSAGYIDIVPLDYAHVFCYVMDSANGPVHTVSQTHIKLPKLSYLITLCPEDFFSLLRLLDTAKNTPSKDSLTLNAPLAGIDSLATSALEPFFMKLRTNYRMNPDYCDRKWTSREDIHFLANLEPTRDNQLSAMQYLTARQNNDLLYFPVDTSVELELDWPQVNDEYCVPPQEG